MMTPEYTLILNSDQAREVLKSVELLMRLKLNQYKELTMNLMDFIADGKPKDFWNRRDLANDYLKLAFDQIYKTKLEHINQSETKWKDEEWFRLYNLYQTIRYALHEAEHPDSLGVDSYPPIRFTDEPMPTVKWEMKE